MSSDAGRIPTYRIREWSVHYETAESRRLKTMSWVPTPTKHDGRGIRRVMRHDPTGAIYGAWCLIVQVAAKCPIRGTLADTDGPLSAIDIADKTGLDERSVQAAIDVCLSNDIKWLEIVPQHEPAATDATQQSNGDATVSPSSRLAMPSDQTDSPSTSPAGPVAPLESPGLHNITGQDRTKQNNKTSPTSSQSAQQPVRSSTGEPATWAEVAEAMRLLKISRREQTMKAAQRNGFNPAQVLAIIDYLQALPAATCKSAAGSLCDRLGTPDAADWDCNENWSWTAADKAEQFSPYDRNPEVERKNAELLKSEKLEHDRRRAKDVERREFAFGDALNAMSDSDILTLIGWNQMTATYVRQDFLAKGRDSPEVRPQLLLNMEMRDTANKQGSGSEQVTTGTKLARSDGPGPAHRDSVGPVDQRKEVAVAS
jgi:hypothetical protein